MELIPILSTIILVATISTFLLAIGAYVLYKVRERKGQQASAPQPSTVKAELVTPGEAPVREPEPVRISQQPVFIESEPVRVSRQPIFVQQYKSSAQTPQTGRPRQYNSGQQQRGYEGASFARANEEKSTDKFYKYTSEGYVTPKEDKGPGALRWR
ncbi:MAG: hypothetical protein R6W90_07510 [Ignavibacteriaceae bacterium]